MNMSLLAIAFIIECMKRRHDYLFCAIRTCFCYGSFSYVVKLRNLTPFILKLMTERMCIVSENSRLGICINYIAVFVKIVNAECALSKAYRVLNLTQVNSNRTMTNYYIRTEDGLKMFTNI